MPRLDRLPILRRSCRGLVPLGLVPLVALGLTLTFVNAVDADGDGDAMALAELEPGDRVLFVGNTLIERAQLYDFVEMAMTTRFEGVTYRNLGWSGDTVSGQARAYFGSPEDGFNHLKEHVHALEPTVIFVAYGLNESYRGEAGLSDFRQGLGRLLDMLEETDARLVLLSPAPHEAESSPLADVSEANANIRLYRDTLADVAASRGHGHVDLYTLVRELETHPPHPLTDNGIHLTAFGYYHLAAALEAGLGWPAREWQVHLRGGEVEQAAGATVDEVNFDDDRVSFEATDDMLPLDMPEHVEATHSNYLPPRVLRVSGLETGAYELAIDGTTVAEAEAEQWAEGVELSSGGPVSHAAGLREKILQKNEFFFHQFRPQNETYIRGFRSHEQGQHEADLPKFDPLIEEQEAAIGHFRMPNTHRYELRRVE